ncbi:hypothetical protein GU90_18385 [Saccharopolyspora rectivirgula]|uniref:Uncharacterized protein n=2 Tax=Saccharopolyspora rectivirgula TaxID=28042 RepID=A0A073B637_9PSEU|nr:hypothetical protein GU90_18385 [Saccharopolyspora rectivirgula]
MRELMAIIKLGTLYCYTTEDNIGGDHPYLKLDGEKVWGPVRMTDGQSERIGATHGFSGSVVVELFEEDDLDPDDLLGRHTLSEGSGKVEFARDGAHYVLDYEIN